MDSGWIIDLSHHVGNARGEHDVEQMLRILRSHNLFLSLCDVCCVCVADRLSTDLIAG